MHREQVTHHCSSCIIVSVTMARWISAIPRSPATMVLVHAGGKSLASFRGLPTIQFVDSLAIKTEEEGLVHFELHQCPPKYTEGGKVPRLKE